MGLTRKHRDSLEGKVLVYSVLLPESSSLAKIYSMSAESHPFFTDGEIFAMFGTTDAADFSKMFGAPVEFVNRMNKEYEKFEAEAMKMAQAALPQNRVKLVYHSIDLSYIQLMHADCDKWFVGALKDQDKCVEEVEKRLYEYFWLYKQQQKKSKAPISRAKPAPSVMYNHFRGDIYEHLLNSYVFPMLDALQRSRQDELRKLKQQFGVFSAGSSIDSDVFNMCEEVQPGRIPDMKLIGLYMRKIAAVYRNDHDSAKTIAGEISSIVP